MPESKSKNAATSAKSGSQFLARLRSLSGADLQQEVRESLKGYFGLRMQKAQQQLTNTALLRQSRRDAARAKTVLTEKLGSRRVRAAKGSAK